MAKLLWIFVIIIGVATILYVATRPPQVAFTMEAKLCPDGSAVGRTGPNCAFALCPGELCTSTGGNISTQNCCGVSGGDNQNFPSSCAIGACGCAPQYSVPTQVCNCPEGKCFQPSQGCVIQGGG
jgi:hypothetical protein